LLRLIGEVGRFDIGGDVITFGAKASELPPRVFLTVIQADGTFKAIEKL
jgi:branched-chain amino acid transport system substrate-binding protein